MTLERAGQYVQGDAWGIKLGRKACCLACDDELEVQCPHVRQAH